MVKFQADRKIEIEDSEFKSYFEGNYADESLELGQFKMFVNFRHIIIGILSLSPL